jgi:hypothetical protein
MLVELFAVGSAIGIAIAVFAIVLVFADRPVKAFIVALLLSYTLFALYIYVLNRILKRKEEKRVVVQ